MMTTEITERYDGSFIKWGYVPIPRLNPEDWTDKSAPQLFHWVPIQTYQWIADIEQ